MDNKSITYLSKANLASNQTYIFPEQIVMDDATNATWNFVVVLNGTWYANSSWFGAKINPSQSKGTVTIEFDGSSFTLMQEGKKIGSADASVWVVSVPTNS